VDKPSGPSSHEVVAWVKRMLRLKQCWPWRNSRDLRQVGAIRWSRAVLPLALEDATKTIQAFLLTGKEYVCLMALHGDVEEKKVREVLDEFVGDILQRPPVRAAVRRECEKAEDLLHQRCRDRCAGSSFQGRMPGRHLHSETRL